MFRFIIRFVLCFTMGKSISIACLFHYVANFMFLMGVSLLLFSKINCHPSITYKISIYMIKGGRNHGLFVCVVVLPILFVFVCFFFFRVSFDLVCVWLFICWVFDCNT